MYCTAQTANPTPATSSSTQLAQHQRLAQQYLAAKRPDLAIPELRAVVQLDPANVDARGNLGVLLYFQGSYADAIPELRAAVTAQSGLAKLQALLGMSEKRTGDLHGAQKDLEASFAGVTDKKIRLDTGLQLVEVDQALGILDEAAATVAQLQTLDPGNPQILAAAYQIYVQGMSEALLSLAVAAPNSAQFPFIMGQQLLQQGQGEKAIVQFRRALAIDPNLPGLHFELAHTLYASSDPAEHAGAAAEYKAAIQINPFDEKAWLGLAALQSEKGDAEEAEASYEKAKSLQPNDAEPYVGLAKLLLAKHDSAKAAELLERAVDLDPTNIAAHYRLSTLYKQQGRAGDAKTQLELYEHYKALQSELETTLQRMRSDSPETAGQVSHSQ
ncbi:tetratricopeptide repeat protein [Acidipila sp. EB88]|nr:tetratricopeptide repeat protein [Acidipila sp. EB88]